MVRERGRDRDDEREMIRRGPGCRSGVVGEDDTGVAIEVVLASLEMVW